MRRKLEAVSSFESSDHGLPRVVRDYRARYRAISQVLDDNPQILTAVHKDLLQLSQGDPGGREADYTSENILRALIVQHLEGRPFREAVIRIGSDPFLQDFIAEVVVDVKPDITLFQDRNEREWAPSDHSAVGALAEQAVRNADTILGGLTVSYGKEMYAYEVDPQREFRPDVFIDIGGVLSSVIETINFFRKLNVESPQAASVGRREATIKIYPGGEELALTAWGEI
jgi:hypothetical protein